MADHLFDKKSKLFKDSCNFMKLVGEYNRLVDTDKYEEAKNKLFSSIRTLRKTIYGCKIKIYGKERDVDQKSLDRAQEWIDICEHKVESREYIKSHLRGAFQVNIKYITGFVPK